MIMKNISKFFSTIALCSLAVLSSCVKGPEISTDQFSDSEVVFANFAPNPVARGGVLRISGSNLQEVESVTIPGIEPIRDIELVSTGRISEIRVTVPVDGPEIGKVSITTKAGKTLTSKAELKYSEPIVLESFSPAAAISGDVITFKGDYLNNIREVIFENNVYVTEFEEQSRYTLKVKVPSQAITGKIILGDVNENDNPDGLVANLFYTEEELIIGDPVVKKASYGVVKAGKEVTVSGTNLDMIAEVKFNGVNSDFTVSNDGKTLTSTLPDTAVDGELVVVSYAGKEFVAGTFETLVPSELVIKADSRYKAGLDVTITGKDIDLVTAGTLAGTELPLAISDNKITFTIPETAKDGTVTLSLANGKTVETEAIELVKPVIKAVSPAELYAGDENITVTGEDLDLVVSATLGGKDIQIAEGTTETSLELVTELTSVSGKVVLALANGVTLESGSEVKVNYHSLVIVSEMPFAQHIGEEVVLKGSKFDLVENIFIGDTKVTQYSLRTPEEVRFLMPWCKAGSYNISFHLFNGDVETVASPIEVQLQREFKTIWEGESYVTWGGGAVTGLSWGGYDWSTVTAGTTLLVNIEVVDNDAVVRIGNGSWSGLPTTRTYPNADGEANLAVGKDITAVAVKLSNADLNELVNNGGLVVCGTGYKVYSIQLITEISQETTIWEGEAIADNWSNQPYVGTDGGAEFSAAGVTAGQTLYFYITPLAEYWKLQIVEGHWGPTYCSYCSVGNDTEGGKFTEWDLDANGGRLPLTVTQEMIDAAMKVGGWGGIFVLNGDKTKVTKITVL